MKPLSSAKVLIACAGVAFAALNLPAAVERPAWPLKVVTTEIVPGAHKAWLADQADKPFLWVADTCWFLAFKLTDEEVRHYLDNRAAKGINVIQAMLVPWTRAGDDHWLGEKPFHDEKLDQPNETYWRHVDAVIAAARQRNLTLCMAIAWNRLPEGWDKILSNDYHRQDDFKALRQYARFLGRRYRDAGNLIVFLGGDSSGNRDLFAVMGSELKKTAPQLLITHHSASWLGHKEAEGIKSSTSAGEHGQGDYLDLSWTYTYWPNQNKRTHSHPYYLNHLEWNRNQQAPTVVSKVRPFLLGESGYENERGSPLHRIRRLMHWNIVCGAIGHGFGNGSIWKAARDWKVQLDSSGSQALGRMAAIYGKYPWWKLVPEQPKAEFFVGEPLRIAGAETFILSGQEVYDNVLSLDEARGEKFVAAARTPDGRLLMAYFPHGYSKPGIEIDLTKLSGPAVAKWIDPHSGTEQSIERGPLPNQGTRVFTPPGPNSFGDRDWVLCLEVISPAR